MGSYHLPPHGQHPEAILSEIHRRKQHDVDALGSRAWSLVYYHSPELHDLVQKVYGFYIAENALNPMAFPSLRQMEREVVEIVGGLVHRPEGGGGTMTSGGTESLFLALKAARDYAVQQRPYLSQMEVVAPISAHPAIDKAAHYLGLRVIHTPTDADGAADVEAMEAAISERTILLIGSAPSYPHGIMDPIPAIASLARRHNLWLHVDACVGGMVWPFLEKLGHPVPPWDFRVEGVTSISVDLHKYGYAPKGASVLLYRSRALRRYQFFVYGGWPGGIYPSATFLGTRAGGAIAAAWAVLHYLGESGYMEATRLAYETTQRIKEAIEALPELYIVGKPRMTILAVGARPPYDIYTIGDGLSERGWFIDRQQKPPSLHLTVSRGHARVVEEFLADLEALIAQVRRQQPSPLSRRIGRSLVRTGLKVLPERWVRAMARWVSRTARSNEPPRRTAAMYGMMGSLPSQGQVETLALDFLDQALGG